MKKLLFVILCLFCCRLTCEDQERDPLRDVEVGQMTDYRFDNNIQVSNPDEALQYIKNIQYEGNVKYWKLPEETYNSGKGLCTDSALLYAYILENNLDIRTNLIMIKSESGDCHSLIKYDNWYIDTVHYFKTTQLLKGWYILYIIPYSEAIWMTFYYHKNVGKYY